MYLVFSIKFYMYQIGKADLLYSLFSTICVRLENGEWGSKYPNIMNKLFKGKLENKFIDEALEEIEEIKEGLRNLPVESLVWDIDDLQAKPNDICAYNLLNYFVNDEEEKIIDLFIFVLKEANELREDIFIKLLGDFEVNWLEEFKKNRNKPEKETQNIRFSTKVAFEVFKDDGIEHEESYYENENIFKSYEVGSADFLDAFFSTVCVRLENGEWGSKYPAIMTKLYPGTLPKEHVSDAIGELKEIKVGLSKLSYKKIVWDIEDREYVPPWLGDIGDDTITLANFFITSDGEYFVEVFEEALKKAEEMGEDLKIVKL